MSKLADLLSQGEVIETPQRKRKENPNLDDLHISRYAHDKAFRYAKLVMERKKRNVEVGGFLTTPSEAKDRVARDAFLAKDQEVREGFYELSPEDVIKAGKELRGKDQRVVGWWHSHGRLPTFHSDTDDKNQMVLLNGISPSNYVTSRNERNYQGLQSSIEGNKIVFFDPKDDSRKFELELQDAPPELVAQSLKVIDEQRTGFAYSFVVNHHRWLRRRVPYCELATREFCSDCSQVHDKSVQVPYRIIEEPSERIDDDKLIAEIDERVHLFGEKGRKYFLPEHWKNRGKDGNSLVDPNSVDDTHFQGVKDFKPSKFGRSSPSLGDYGLFSQKGLFDEEDQNDQ